MLQDLTLAIQTFRLSDSRDNIYDTLNNTFYGATSEIWYRD